MLKPIAQVEAQVRRRLAGDMHAAAVREARERMDAGPWPLSIALGRPSRAELVGDIAEVVHYGGQLTSWAEGLGLQVEWEERRAGGLQRVPAHVVVADINAAAHVCGGEACRHLARLRSRAQTLAVRFPSAGDDILEAVLRKSDSYTDVDFDLLVEASAWFAAHDAQGLTPRQVPLPGFHAKWLDTSGRRSLVCQLAGKDTLGLTGRPALTAFAYLDPSWLAAGGRRYDSHVMGDVGASAYEPSFILVVENKDTYLAFPQMAGGVCVFGAGRSGADALPGIPWVAQCPTLLYWGDMDAAGLEILDAYRANGLNMRSLLMDLDAYEEFRRYGTNQAAGKQQLSSHRRVSTPHLTADEQELYDLLTAPKCPGPRRIEQERIPLTRAVEEVEGLLGTVGWADLPHQGRA